MADNVYNTPQSDLASSEDSKILAQLLQEQHPVLGIIIALFVPPAVLAIMSLAKGGSFVFLFIIPGIVAGFLIKYIVRPIKLAHRVIPGLIVSVIVFLAFSAGGINVFGLALLALNFIACITLSRRPLNYDQEKILYRYQLGRLKP